MQLEERHKKERSEHQSSVENSNSLSEANEGTDESKNHAQKASNEVSENAASTDTSVEVNEEELQRQRKMEKARRKREKQKEKERRREEEIAAEKAATLGRTPRDLENAQLKQILQPLNLAVRDVPADGHCLYRAVAAQLSEGEGPIDGIGADSSSSNPSNTDYVRIRAICAQALQEKQEEFAPFVEYNEGTVEGDYAAYVERVRSSSDWGGHLELRALAMALNRPIHVYSTNSTTAMVITGDGDDGNSDKVPIRLSYHLHYYSLGEHYNQVVAASSTKDQAQ